MLASLDDSRALDPAVSGAKAAWLARARQARLPVLPGVVVAADQSESFLRLGEVQLSSHNSGRARMAITASELPASLRDELAGATADLPAPLVVRSSSVLEGSGVWSGAFTSYLDIRHGELPKAMVGCYASAFTQATVARFEAAGLSPSAAKLAVLIQPALDPDYGGTARIAGDDVTVAGIKGSPVPLVQGWEPGVHAGVSSDGTVRGEAAIEALGSSLISEVAELLRRSQLAVGANSCEWAYQDGRLWLLQLMRSATAQDSDRSETPAELASAGAAAVARLVRRYPGPLGERLVLPWAIADPTLAELEVRPAAFEPRTALDEAVTLAAALTAEVWSRPKPKAIPAAAQALRELRGTRPGEALRQVASLRVPSREKVAGLLSLLATVRDALVSAGVVVHAESAWHVDLDLSHSILAGAAAAATTRIGYDRWDPFQAGVIAATGRAVSGVAAAPGVAFGRMCIATSPERAQRLRPRDVIVATHPVPGLAALLFDAAGLVTTGGGPAAHLFESARALGIPAVCAVRIEDIVGGEREAIEGEWALAVDGDAATVHATQW